MSKTATRYDRFKAWANGEPLVAGTKDHHALYAIRRFELFEANQRRKAALKEEVK